MSSSLKIKAIKPWKLVAVMVILLLPLILIVHSWYWPKGIVRIANQELRVLVANTDRHRFQGLSDRADLGHFQGMLFVFPDRGQHEMVMRAMHFPLDIIWIDKGIIIDIAPHLAPEPNRTEAELTPYFSRLPSTLVLELPAGFAEEHGLKVGDRVVTAY